MSKRALTYPRMYESLYSLDNKLKRATICIVLYNEGGVGQEFDTSRKCFVRFLKLLYNRILP